MVRTNTNETQSEDKKESTKKKTSPAQKKLVTGVWPCKINGCNKQFAREADLKRHQRTTKTHSMPGFACPQCDATFTRTDALRRHQKSRHNGVVIEPTDQEKQSRQEDASSSKSRSSSTTPSSKGKERDTPTQSSNPNPMTGQNSYYRPHTATSSNFAPRPSQPPVDSQYAQANLLPSTTRLNQPSGWVPPPWPDGPPQMSAISYHPVPGPHPGYFTSSHYRLNPPIIQPQHTALSSTANRSSPHEDKSRTATPTRNNDSALEAEKSSPVLNSSIESSPDNVETSRPTERDKINISLELTQAAVQAVLKSAQDQAKAGDRKSPSTPSEGRQRHLGGGTASLSLVDGQSEIVGDDDDVNTEGELNISSQLSPEDKPVGTMPLYRSSLQRPEPMEHMLTEDGEPMLNPAELLTQESLASPPP